MPNYVMNEVTFRGNEEEIKKLRALLKSNVNEFDFNKVIPMPESLNLEDGSDTEVAIQAAKAKRAGKIHCDYIEERIWARERHTYDEWAAIGEKYLQNIDKYGFPTWYGWRNKYWGTKWNSDDVEWISDNTVRFTTAWNMPQPVYEKISELFPDLTFYVLFADEDIGNNCGHVWYEEGNFNVEYDGDVELACELWGLDPSEIEQCEEEDYESAVWQDGYDEDDEYDDEEPETEELTNEHERVFTTAGN